MKMTKNMIYKETVESRELNLYVFNDAKTWIECVMPAMATLKRHYKKGSYSRDKATQLFYRVACQGAKNYITEFGGSFDVTCRWTVAVDLQQAIYNEYLTPLGGNNEKE